MKLVGRFSRRSRFNALGCALLSLALASACGKAEIAVAVEPSELQRRVNALFPVSRPVLFSRVTLENPKVELAEGSNRIGISLQVRAEAPLLPEARGQLAVSGLLSYRTSEKSFYLQEATLDRLEIQGLTAEQTQALRQPVEAVARAVLASVPVYQFRQRDMKEITAEHTLRDVTVKDGKLYLTLGLPR